MKQGRPTVYNETVAQEICLRLAGGESLRRICKDESMPAISSVMLWLIDGNHKAFSEQYAISRQIQAEHIADELMDIADDGSNDWMERNDAEGNAVGYQLNGEHVQRSRLRLDTRKWYLSKMLPRFREGEQESMKVVAQALEIVRASRPD